MKQFIVRTNNPAFDGVLAGVKFKDGEAIVNELTISKKLGHSVEAVLLMMKKDFGHDVVEYGDDGRKTPWEPEPAAAPAEPATVAQAPAEPSPEVAVSTSTPKKKAGKEK